MENEQDLQEIMDRPIWQLMSFVTSLYEEDPDDGFTITFDHKGKRYTVSLLVKEEETDVGHMH